MWINVIYTHKYFIISGDYPQLGKSGLLPVPQDNHIAYTLHVSWNTSEPKVMQGRQFGSEGKI